MPAETVLNFAVTVPAGTPQDQPQLTNLAMPAREVVAITVRVPPGPRGEVGFAVWASGLTVIPQQTGAWIVTDDEEITWELTNQINSGGWQLAAYNNGSFDHTLYVRFQLVTLPTSTVAVTQPPIALVDLSSGGGS